MTTRLVGKEFINTMRDSEGKGSPVGVSKQYVSKLKGSRKSIAPSQVKDANKKRPVAPKAVKEARSELPEREAFERRLKTLKRSNPAVYRQLMQRMGK